MSFYHPPGGGQLWPTAVFAVGFLIAIMLALYLAFSILRGRHE